MADQFNPGGRVLTGRPTSAALAMLLGAYGFEIEQSTDWQTLLRRHPSARGVRDYRVGRRVTVRCRARS